jgi:3-dehydrosphinganine reductase
MFTPGFENENKTKPAITKKIEEGGDGMTPQQAAVAMLKGQSHFNIYTLSIVYISILMRSTTKSDDASLPMHPLHQYIAN